MQMKLRRKYGEHRNNSPTRMIIHYVNYYYCIVNVCALKEVVRHAVKTPFHSLTVMLGLLSTRTLGCLLCSPLLSKKENGILETVCCLLVRMVEWKVTHSLLASICMYVI